MGKMNTIFFWLGGVLSETVPEITIQVLSSQLAGRINFQTRLLLQGMAQELSLGQIDSQLFCRRSVESNGINISIDDLETQIKTAVTVRTSVLEVIEHLPEAYQIWLIADYPPEWYQSFAERLNLNPYFPEDRLIFTARSHLKRIDPDIFYHIVQQADQPIDACVMVDGISGRAVHAVRHGLSSIIFVDATRLIREFTLRGILPMHDL
jgi:beta-phosphoglucomutase-like phosphatase (HAD superfamily)